MMHPVDNLQRAAKVIRSDGTEGIITASRLVGRYTALGMLVMFLRDQFNQDGSWPDDPDTESKIREALENEGLLEICHFSPLLGRGIIYDEKGQPTYVLEVSRMYKPEPADWVHTRMFMQGPDDYQTIPAGPHPFKKAFDEIRRAHEEAVMAELENSDLS